MPESTDLRADSVSLAERRLKAATRIAALRISLDKSQELEQTASETTAYPAEKRIKQAIKVAALRAEINNYQQIGKPAAARAHERAASKEVSLVLSSSQSNDQSEHQSFTPKGHSKAGQNTTFKSLWFFAQVRKLLLKRGIKKTSPTK